ncbi:hypothetical protein M433DRAFT_641 [Acidomyces richmondensis BFW]|nr:MAG: hypothetical protein FE78DRAFT_146071 [Acidomyces sp. 'richmondensis']KYG50031.1 hypothetical protein M433DRAFT_641 [Acidomyces richmondensis BFW]
MAEPAVKKRRLSPSGPHGLPGFAQWDLEHAYEQRVRKKKKEISEKLPVRTAEGWKENERYAHELKERTSDPSSLLGNIENQQEERDSGIGDVENTPVDGSKRRVSVKEEIWHAKEDLARIAAQISESPEENVAQLTHLAEIYENSKIVTVQKLALAAQLAVYRDIIPGYRIRPLGKEMTEGKLSKDVKRLRMFEQTLLSGYKGYVQTLEKIAFGNNELSSAAIGCATALLGSVWHFNFRNDLIAIVIKKACSKTISVDGEKCLEALETLFREDEDGHASLEVVRQLTKMMKTKEYQIHEKVLNTFLQLRLLSEFAHKASTTSIDRDESEKTSTRQPIEKKHRQFRTKRERKLLKQKKQVENEMKEADAVVSHEERDKNQADTLKLVFVAYFSILKARVQHLMGAVLEGLAKYSHLINQDFFGDILEALKDLIKNAETLDSEGDDEEDDDKIDNKEIFTQRYATRESLLCIITAFALLHGQQDVAKSANSLHLDLNFFTTHLYRTLIPVALNPDIEISAKSTQLQPSSDRLSPSVRDLKVDAGTTIVLLLRSIQSVILPSISVKSVPPIRVAAFTKQLMTLALHLPPKSATAVTNMLQQVAKVHGKKIAALWHTEERKGDGVFDPLSEQVESSNPFATTVWEGEILRCHFDPKVRESVKLVEKYIIDARG